MNAARPNDMIEHKSESLATWALQAGIAVVVAILLAMMFFFSMLGWRRHTAKKTR